MPDAIDLIDTEDEEEKEEEEDEEDEECEALEDEYADFGIPGDERKEPPPSSSSSFPSSSASALLHQKLQRQQLLADELLAQNVFLHENRHLIQSPPSTSFFPSSSFTPQPRWTSSHPDDPSQSPSLQDHFIAQHHEHLNSASPFVDVHSLFLLYAQLFFFNQLSAVSVRWSKRMTSCAGLCSFDVRSGGCEIALSESLLKFRSKKEVVETLLHEMVHAYLFVGDHTQRDHDAHGPNFCQHMARINATLGLNISVYHSFFQEVKQYKVHVWQCQGKCKNWKPYHGKVSRVANRKPSLADRWFAQHQANCGGEFIKVAGPSEQEMKEARKERARRRREEKKAEKASKEKREQKSKDRKRGLKQTDLRGALTPVKRERDVDEGEVEEMKSGGVGEEKKATARAEADVAGEKPTKKRRKRMKGKGHVLGTGREEGKKKRSARKKKGAGDDALPVNNDGAQQSDGSAHLHPVMATPLPALSPQLQPAGASSSPSSSSASSSTSAAPSPLSSATSNSPAVSSSSAASPAVTVARRGTNIFALMQARGEGAKVVQLVQKASAPTQK